MHYKVTSEFVLTLKKDIEKIHIISKISKQNY